MGASQRNKGSRAERELLNEIRDELGDFFGPLDKNWNQREEQRWDIELGPFAVEVKRVQKLSVGAWWQEAVGQVKGTELMPMLAYRQNFQPWTIVLSLVDVGYLMTGDATNLQSNNTPAGHYDWHKHINFTIAMSLPGFAFFCREYVSPEVARGEALP